MHGATMRFIAASFLTLKPFRKFVINYKTVTDFGFAACGFI